MPAVRPKTPVHKGTTPMANTLLHSQIAAALACLRTARFDGNPELIDGCEHHLNALLDRLHETVPA